MSQPEIPDNCPKCGSELVALDSFNQDSLEYNEECAVFACGTKLLLVTLNDYITKGKIIEGNMCLANQLVTITAERDLLKNNI